MPIRNATVYDRHAIRCYIVFQAIRRRVARMILALLLGLVSLCLSVLGAVHQGVHSVYTVCGVILVLLFVALACRLLLEPYLRYKNEVGSWSVTNSYEFYSKDFVARSSRVDGGRNSGLRYSALDSVYETEEFLYLCPTAATAFIVCKAGFTPEELVSVLALLRREVDDGRLHLKNK